MIHARPTHLPLAFLAALAVAGCLSEPSATSLRWEPLEAGDRSGFASPRDLVLRDAEAWEAFYAQHAGWQEPVPDAPAVDFGQWQVAALMLGERGTTGHRATIASAEARGDGGVLTYRLQEPDGGFEQISQPYVLVLVERTDGPLRIERG